MKGRSGMSIKNADRMRAGQVWANGSSVYRLLGDPEYRPTSAFDEETQEWTEYERLMVRVEPMPARDGIPDGGHWVDASCFPYMRLMVDAAGFASPVRERREAVASASVGADGEHTPRGRA